MSNPHPTDGLARLEYEAKRRAEGADMSDTPRTDDVATNAKPQDGMGLAASLLMQMTDLSRELERENTALRAKLEACERDAAPVAKIVFDCSYEDGKLVSKRNPQIFRTEVDLMQFDPDTPLYAAPASEEDAFVRVPMEPTEELNALRARLKACERDAERYRWLRGDQGPQSARWPRWQIAHWNGVWNDVSGPDMDAAIDAAREKP